MASARLNRRRRKVNTSRSVFDQIISRSEKLFTNCQKADETALSLLDLLGRCQDRWKRDFIKLRSQLRILKTEKRRLMSLQEHTRKMLEVETERRRRVERTKHWLEKKIDLLRQVLLENDVDGAKRELESIGIAPQSPDANFGDFDRSAGSLLDPHNVSLDSSSGVIDPPEKSSRNSTKGERRQSARLNKKHGDMTAPFKSSDVHSEQNVRLSSATGRVRRSQRRSATNTDTKTQRTDAVNRLNRPHEFTSRTALRMETCSVCGRRITFGKTAYKCIVCRLVVHHGCRQQLTQTCVPSTLTRPPMTPLTGKHTPTTSPRRPGLHLTQNSFTQPRTNYTTDPILGSPTFISRMISKNLNLADLCPTEQFPRVPALVIHCVNEVLARGLRTVGIYRVSGSEKQVRELYEKFLRSKNTPSLALVDDIHVVCGCLKLFLRNLDEPLVTFIQRPILAEASELYSSDPETALQSVINVLDNLARPNRDTLSFIMLHLKTVASTPTCQMGEDNLAKVFGPTLVGYSCPEPQLMQTVNETRTQQAVVRLLFAIPNDVYSAIISQTNCDCAESDRSTYFSPLVGNAENIAPTPNPPSRKPAGGTTGLSARKRFFPNLLLSGREPMGSSSNV